MPHMMPMLWLSMMLYTLMIMFIITSMIYFMYIPSQNYNTQNYSLNKYTNWNWKW